MLNPALFHSYQLATATTLNVSLCLNEHLSFKSSVTLNYQQRGETAGSQKFHSATMPPMAKRHYGYQSVSPDSVVCIMPPPSPSSLHDSPLKNTTTSPKREQPSLAIPSLTLSPPKLQRHSSAPLTVTSANKTTPFRPHDQLQKDIQASIWAYGETHSITARLYLDLGNVEFRRGRFTAAVVAYEHAAQCTSERPVAQLNQGTLCWRLGDTHTAIRLLQLARDSSPDLRIRASANHQLGVCFALVGDEDAAGRSLQAALEMRSYVYGAKHIAVVRTLDTIGRAQYLLGKFESAVQWHRKALRLLLDGGKHSTTSTLTQIVKAYNATGNTEKAQALLTEVAGVQSDNRSVWLEETKKILRELREPSRKHHSKTA